MSGEKLPEEVPAHIKGARRVVVSLGRPEADAAELTFIDYHDQRLSLEGYAEKGPQMAREVFAQLGTLSPDDPSYRPLLESAQTGFQHYFSKAQQA